MWGWWDEKRLQRLWTNPHSRQMLFVAWEYDCWIPSVKQFYAYMYISAHTYTTHMYVFPTTYILNCTHLSKKLWLCTFFVSEAWISASTWKWDIKQHSGHFFYASFYACLLFPKLRKTFLCPLLFLIFAFFICAEADALVRLECMEFKVFDFVGQKCELNYERVHTKESNIPVAYTRQVFVMFQ